uniref:Peptidase_M13 domain-containing protein n=1 Tax=Strongyloides venezuelensis TaxID=75913 RepID=A0A0K0EZY0_STRVS
MFDNMKFIISNIFVYFLCLILVVNGCTNLFSKLEDKATPSSASVSTESTILSDDFDDNETFTDYYNEYSDSSEESSNSSTTESVKSESLIGKILETGQSKNIENAIEKGNSENNPSIKTRKKRSVYYDSENFQSELTNKIESLSKFKKGKIEKDNDPSGINQLKNLISSNQYLADYVDLSVNPCDNFYKFTCKKQLLPVNTKKRSKGKKTTDNDFNFTHLVEEVFKGKLNEKSDILKNLQSLGEKCHTSTNADDIFNCLKSVKGFESYAIASYFKNNLNNDDEMNDNFVNNVIDDVKGQFKSLSDRNIKLLDEAMSDDFAKKSENMEFTTGNDEDPDGLSLMENCYKYFKFSLDHNKNDITDEINKYESNIPDNDKELRSKCMRYIKTYSQKYSDNINLFELLFSEVASYHPKNNEALINPLAFKLQEFNSSYPMSLFFGKMGFIIGREILDNLGDKYLKDNDNNECFAKLISNEFDKLSDQNKNGMLKLSEIIADNGGIKIAHQAYMNNLANMDSKVYDVDGFNKQLHDQLFFIGVGAGLCEVLRDETSGGRQNIPSNLVELRVIKTLGSYKPFLEAFNCNEGTRMYSKNTCEL